MEITTGLPDMEVEGPLIISNGQGKMREFGILIHSIAFLVIKRIAARSYNINFLSFKKL